jgi:hypothetical protein
MTGPHSRLCRSTWLLPSALAAFVTLLYLWPQIVHSARGHAGVVLLHEDEAHYAIRFARALWGQPAMSPLLFEHRHDLSLVSGFGEAALAWPWRSLPAALMPSVDALVILYRALLSFGGVLALTFALRSVGMSQPLSALLAFWTYVDRGVLVYKPLLGLTWSHYVLDRFTNPLLGLPLFCVAWGSLARCLLARELRPSWCVLCGLSAGALFYVNFYYWTLFVAVTACVCLLDPRTRVPRALLVATITALVAARYLVYAADFRAHPLYRELLWRCDFARHGLGVSFGPNKSFWLFALAALSAWRVGTPQARFLVASVAAGLLCYYSALVTGLELPNSMQADHWNYGLAPLVLAACVWHAASWLAHSRYARHAKIAYLTLVAALSCGGVFGFARLANALDPPPMPATGTLDPAYDTAWQWLRTHAPADAVIVSSDTTMSYEVLKAGRYVWIHHSVYPDAVASDEILARYRVLWALEGVSPAQLEQRLLSSYGEHEWLWRWGLTRELIDELRADHWPVISALHVRHFARVITDTVQQTTPSELANIGRRYRLDYLVRGPNERAWSNASRVLDLEPVYEAYGVHVERVRGFR